MINKIIFVLILTNCFLFAKNGNIELMFLKNSLIYAEKDRIQGDEFIASGKTNSTDISGLNLKFSFAVPSYSRNYENYGFVDIIYSNRKGYTSFDQDTSSIDSDQIKHNIDSLSIYWVPDREYGLLFNSSVIVSLDYFKWQRYVEQNSLNFENKTVTILNFALGYEGEYAITNNVILDFKGLYKMSLFGNVNVNLSQSDIQRDINLGASKAYELSVGAKYLLTKVLYIRMMYTILDMDIGNSDIKDSYQESEVSFVENRFYLGFGILF